MAYDGYRNSGFDPPGFNPNPSINSNQGANGSSTSINNSSHPNAAYSGYLQPPYGENYAAEQDTQQQHPPQQQQVPYTSSSASNQGTEYPDPASFYPPPTGHPPPHGDALKQPPFSPTASRQGPPQQPPPPPRVPDPSYPSPDLIAQVTAAVIQQLRLANPNNNPPPPPPPPHPSLQQQNYQPPTPALSNTSYKQSPNPDTLSPNTTTGQYIPPSSSVSAQPDLSNAPAQSAYAPPIPSKFDENAYPSAAVQRPPSRPGSAHQLPPPSPGMERTRGSSFGSLNGGQEGSRRPKGPSRLSTATDITTLERIWGTLFDKDDTPTSRIGQLLRGIAVHLIENYPPGNTLVITPEKMQKFYSDNSVPSDPYPWRDIFDNRTSSISRLYRSMSIEHHLIQVRLDERPDIPGLTPRGFERWMTMMIQAHPEREFDRLQSVIQNMPISNPDDKKERFPKELSRRLFPKLADYDIKDTLDRWIGTHCHVEITQGMLEEPSLRHPRAKSSIDNTSAGLPSRPASADVRPKQIPPAATVEDADDEYDDQIAASSADVDVPVTQPIERERKPYSMPKLNKTYRDETSSPVPTGSTTTANTSSRHQDSGSGINTSRKQHVVIYDGEDDEVLSPSDDIDSKYSTSHHGHTRSHSHSHPHGHGHLHDDIKRHHGKDRDRDRDLDWGGDIGRDRDRTRNSWGSDEEFYRSSISDRDRGRRRGESRGRHGHLSTFDNLWGYR
ncbi:uncharacterized protein GIQ15_05881 [Arthroderma uncinatum]|uniref:uncharacterized protein n=1 Tax=Arthroderma uncinatum TaxID=74035 RepID=UPI00144A7742|nr:uncharacterized protein GIQ15_05881 [Arthroderma uncinatum]KAF3480534.1 hypothetical protein GIQ15_05881 [Arthroderma uncinatum]